MLVTSRAVKMKPEVRAVDRILAFDPQRGHATVLPCDDRFNEDGDGGKHWRKMPVTAVLS